MTSPFLVIEEAKRDPRLHGGAFFLDDTACTKELAVNAGCIEVWRRTECYLLYQTVSLCASVSQLRHYSTDT